jgi:voltage-gated potassium channel Kch
MFSKILIAWSLMALCVVIHATGMAFALRLWRHPKAAARGLLRATWFFIRLAAWIVLLHLFEITTWAFVYVRNNAIADLQSALYFSAVTYTTTGYGDMVLPREWRLVGAVEALTGILMCGWSTGFFFAVVSRMFGVKNHPVES